MIKRSQSFSKGGKIIQRIMEIEKYKIDQDQLQNILKKKNGKMAEIFQNKKQPIQIQGFDKIPGREKPNSFLLFNVKDTNTKIDYNYSKDKVLSKAPQPTINKEKNERLSELFKRQIYSSQDKQCCKRHAQTNNQHIRTPNDLQSYRKSCHSLNFQKQTQRPFDEKIKKMTLQAEKQLLLTRSNSLNDVNSKRHTDRNSFIKPQKVHSFASYTKRDFLSEKKIKCAPEVSGIDCFKINPQKFKGNWKIVNPPRFDTVPDKHLNRYDRDCPQWHPQLNYNIKNTIRTIKSNLDFANQTSRRDNFVKSGYPIRIAI